MLVSAQVAGAGSPAVVNTPAAGPAAVAGASTTVATLQAEQSVSSVPVSYTHLDVYKRQD